jgi:hypothetical protein
LSKNVVKIAAKTQYMEHGKKRSSVKNLTAQDRFSTKIKRIL